MVDASCLLLAAALGVAARDEVVTGSIDADSPPAVSDRLAQPLFTLWPARSRTSRLVLEKGTWTCDLVSHDFDAYLLVRDADGALLGEDDDGGVGPHARVVFELVEARALELAAAALDGGTGRFELRVRPGAPPPRAARDQRSDELDDARAEVAARRERAATHPLDLAASASRLASLLAVNGLDDEARPLREEAAALHEAHDDSSRARRAISAFGVAAAVLGAQAPEKERVALEAAAREVAESIGPRNDRFVQLLELSALGHFSSQVKPGAVALDPRAGAAAVLLHEQATRLAAKVDGEWHPLTASRHAKGAEVLLQQARSALAVPHAETALEVVEAFEGDESRAALKHRSTLALLYLQLGRCLEAKAQYERVFAIRDALAIGEDGDLVAALSGYGHALYLCGEAERSLQLQQRALDLFGRLKGCDPRIEANVLANLASALDDLGRYGEEGPYIERAIAVAGAAKSFDLHVFLVCQNNRAMLLDSRGAFDEARRIYSKVVEDRETHFGPDDPALATTLANLGTLLREMGDYEGARRHLERALALRDSTPGLGGVRFAMARSNLGLVLLATGDIEGARRQFELSLAIGEALLAPGARVRAATLTNFGMLNSIIGHDDEAIVWYRRALAEYERAGRAGHQDVAQLRNNMGVLLLSMGFLAEARAQLEDALAIHEATIGPDHPETALSRANFGSLLLETGDVDGARSCFVRALAATRKTVGDDHPATAKCLARIAGLDRRLGRDGEARAGYERAFATFEQTLGTTHLDTIKCLEDLALLCIHQQEWAAAHSWSDRLCDATDELARTWSRRAPEAELATVLAHCSDALSIRVAIAQHAGAGGAAACHDAVIDYKQGVVREIASRRAAIRESKDPKLAEALRRLALVRAALSDLFAIVAPRDRAQHERDLELLRRERNILEAEVADALAVRPQPASPSSADLSAALPAAAVFLDFLVLNDAVAVAESGAAAPGVGNKPAPRLHAWVVRGGGAPPTWLDLGPIDEMEEAIRSFLAVVVGGRSGAGRGAGPSGGSKELRAARMAAIDGLRRRLWEPIASAIGAATRLFVSPDGALGLLPLGVVVDSGGRHLIERFDVANVDDPRTLLLLGRSAAAATTVTPSLLVVGDVDFGGAAPSDAPRVASTRTGLAGRWPALAGTAAEVDGLLRLHRDAFHGATCLPLRGREPSEARLKSEFQHHSVLHLATHGYFLADDAKELDAARASPQQAERGLLARCFPSLLCGLVCAGANDLAFAGDHELLTGDEIAGLDLCGCDLAVLSACDSGLGRIAAAGQGSMSLARAFRDAGARTVVASLWRVEDSATCDLMLDFYRRLWKDGQGRLDALLGAQRALLERNRAERGDTLPATWGAFLLTGETE